MKAGNFKKDYIGLTTDEVEQSRVNNGINSLGVVKKEGIIKKILKTFKEPMFLLLLGTCFIYLILGEINDCLIMLFSVSFIVGITFYQEYKTDKALEALKELSTSKSRVIRNNEILDIKSEELVVGDIMLIKEGDVINADGNILECHDFGVNESSLTGESTIVWKKIKLNANDNKEYFKKNKCYAGTIVTGGEAIVLVTAVGINTEYGKIGNELKKISDQKTLLEKQIRKLIIICASISIGLLFLVGIVTFINNINNAPTLLSRITDAVLAGITIAIATIPEELPVILTIFLTMGAYLISKQKALVRKMSAVETLGSVSVLCVDKTGTLTENKMVVSDFYAYKDKLELVNASYLACEIEALDPMEQAILNFCKKQKITTTLKKEDIFYEYPFSSESKIMGHVYKENKKYNTYVKGASEKVLPLCSLTEKEISEINDKILYFSQKGYRVLALASNTSSRMKKSLDEQHLSFLGLLAFSDPLKPKVKEAIKICRQAGIKLVMITGDNGETAKAIGKEIGFKEYEKIITGEELEKMSDGQLSEAVKDVCIFARVYPNHKMRIVEAFQKNKMVVAMTGDGVNDATALKKAEIGIAMGSGTEVAKEAAKLILLDDNFETIVTAIKNGRRIYDNIRKSVGYILIIHIPIALIALLIPLLGLPILLLPIHVVILELIIDPTSSIIFERSRASEDIMKRLPRQIEENLLNKNCVLLYIIQGLVISLGFLGSYLFMISNDYSQELSTTFSLAVLILSNLLIVFVNINDNLSITNFINTLQDRVIVIINLVILIGLLSIIYVPFLQKLVGTTALNIFQLISALSVAIVCTLWYDLVKIVKSFDNRI
jgi:Ca2+-transporting ATPase